MGIISANFIPASDQHTGKVPALSLSAMSRPSPSKPPNAGKLGLPMRPKFKTIGRRFSAPNP